MMQISCFGQSGRLVGFGISPFLFGPDPLIKINLSPFGVKIREDIASPVSLVFFVIGDPSNFDPEATQIFLTPLSLYTQATFSPFDDTVKLVGKGALIISLIVKSSFAEQREKRVRCRPRKIVYA